MLRQIGHFCRTANTPYGYIQTNEELVACYFKKDVKPDTFKAYIMPISWSSHGPTVLTMIGEMLLVLYAYVHMYIGGIDRFG